MLQHLLQQGAGISAFGMTAARAALQSIRPGNGAAPTVPGSEIVEVIAPRSPDLVRDYVREVGGDPRSYRDKLPPHMFCQWGIALAARTLRSLPYPIARVLNGGCRLEIRGELPADRPLSVRSRLESLDDDGRRVVLGVRIATGIEAEPELVVAELRSIIPLGDGGGSRKERPRVSVDAEELAYWRISAGAGKNFALLTGDINPIHWSPRYARAFGFRRPILHGFATMARAYEGLIKNRYAGDTGAIAVFDARFTRPLLLPNEVGLYREGPGRIAVGAAAGGPAYMTGSYS